MKVSLQNGCQATSPPRRKFATIRVKLIMYYELKTPTVDTQAHPTRNPEKHHSLVLKALIMGGGIQHKIRNLDSMIQMLEHILCAMYAREHLKLKLTITHLSSATKLQANCGQSLWTYYYI